MEKRQVSSQLDSFRVLSCCSHSFGEGGGGGGSDGESNGDSGGCGGAEGSEDSEGGYGGSEVVVIRSVKVASG